MMQLTPHHQIHVAIASVDFRKGITGLATVCQHHLRQDPFSGHVFVFRNRLKTAVKLLVYDGNGFWCCHERFSSGRLAWLPTHETDTVRLSAVNLHVLLQQGHPGQVHCPQPWSPVSTV